MNAINIALPTISALCVALQPMAAAAQMSGDRYGLHQFGWSQLLPPAALGPFVTSEDGAWGGGGVTNASTCMSKQRGNSPDHIVVVLEENHGYLQIIGNPDAAYINSLAAIGMLFTNYHAVGHPSQPNYFALFSGSTQGATGDGEYFFPNTPTLGGELQHAGYSFVGYAEAQADRDHTPWVSFGDSQWASQSFSHFPTDYSALPTVSFVSPNLQNNMHDGTIAQGDQWLKANLSAYASWAMSHNSLLIVTFDEDQGTRNNRVATVVVGAGVAPGRSANRVDHFALLHTIEVFYRLPSLGASELAPVMEFALATELCNK